MLEEEGHEVRIPAFDDYPNYSTLHILEHNRRLMEWADEVYYVWDARSPGVVFDFGMAFALRKPLRKWYVNDKTIEQGIEQYEKYLEEVNKGAIT
jgi:nucleoside 2-deoxyribosyltransferase